MICHCWNCCHSIENGHPIGYPKRFHNGIFETYGTFCSFECLKRYNMEVKNSVQQSRAMSNITLMRKKLLGVLTPLKAAPSRLCLKMFGGSLEIDEYRKNTGNYSLVLPDSVKLNVAVASENDQCQAGSSSHPKQDRHMDARMEILRSESNEGDFQNLKLKRPSNVVRKTTNIATLLGLLPKN